MSAQVEGTPVDRDAVRDGVIDIIRGYAKVKELSAATQLDKIGVDSFDFVEIVFKIEEKYGVEIDYNANASFSDISTVGLLADKVVALVEAKKTA
ncbi:acyl carrier protein [Chenggangzhangella methanolivorans]|uniref:Acyl carrier protein n=1 Tax=Chenggangzhangella methanolivorans TaxID=1437009 RepID=A0A9E6RCL1_9HYPH|nr:acyl carrier protein [Chenggangzhangella methanolivorans]QZN98580.1 acyl carrier protein [Chenggangzhangella methanolivorans]